MFSINGFGTKLYGKSNVNEVDNSYITTKFFVLFFIPIFPMGSYRVIKGKEEQSGSFTLREYQIGYQMKKVQSNIPQIIKIYLFAYLLIALLFWSLFYFNIDISIYIFIVGLFALIAIARRGYIF
jgi:hypothetical protein